MNTVSASMRIYMYKSKQLKEYPYSGLMLDNELPFYNSHNHDSNNSNNYESSPSLYSSNLLQNQGSNAVDREEIQTKDPLLKRIVIVDDNPDITLTFKAGLEDYNYYYHDDKRQFEVYTYNSSVRALSEFKPDFYDLMLIDINMPDMNGFELCEKIVQLDANIRVCFISSAEVNIEALREVYPNVSFGCFIKKPVSIEYLVKKLSAELD